MAPDESHHRVCDQNSSGSGDQSKQKKVMAHPDPIQSRLESAMDKTMERVQVCYAEAYGPMTCDPAAEKVRSVHDDDDERRMQSPEDSRCSLSRRAPSDTEETCGSSWLKWLMGLQEGWGEECHERREKSIGGSSIESMVRRMVHYGYTMVCME